MKRNKQAAPNAATIDAPEPLFTVETANRTLIYVRRIVADIVSGHRELMNLRDQRADLSTASPAPASLDNLRADIERRIAKLNGLQEELKDVGCELKDWASGLIDFPALRDGRKVWLCWRLGEGEISHWHELSEGFAGRKPL
jgi:hypothetical protein